MTTILNGSRGYADASRRTRMNEEEALRVEIENHITKLEVLQRERGQLRQDLEHLKLNLDFNV